MIKVLSVVVLICFWTLTLFANPKTIVELGKGDGHVDFHAIGNPSSLKIHGVGGKPTGQIIVEENKVYGTIIFLLDTLDTKIKLRNEHTKKKYLEIDKYPEARLEITEVKFPGPIPKGDFSLDNLSFQGKLTVHGVTKPVVGKTKIEREGNTISVEAGFTIKVIDFNIKTPSFAGITMADNVNIEAVFTAPSTTVK
ncbi:MAG: YceI family protein [Oligoflexia bacterium]|nr:YceI family protein [Oligoflexia bacterium]